MKVISAITLRTAAILSLATGALGCSRSDDVITLPPRTELAVSLSQTTRSDRVTPGVKLRGKLEKSLLLDDETVLEAGQPVVLEVVSSRAAEGDAPARISLVLTKVVVPSGHASVETEPLEIVGRPQGTSDAEKIAAGAVDGAVVGGIVEGSDRAAIGAVAGGVMAVATKGDVIVLPAGQKLLFTTTDSLEVPRS